MSVLLTSARPLLACAALLAVLATGPARAQDTDQEMGRNMGHVAAAEAQLRTAALAISEATDQLEAARGASDRATALAAAIRTLEDALAAMRQGLRISLAQEQRLRDQLDGREAELAAMLAVAQTLERAPAPAFLLHPDGPVSATRSAMILRELGPALYGGAARMGGAVDELSALNAVHRATEAELRAGLAGLQQARSALNNAFENREQAPQTILGDTEAMAALRSLSSNLDFFAEGLASLEPLRESDGAVPFADRIGSLALPAAGEILRQYREADAAGLARPGLILSTLPQALVRVPVDSVVRFAGPFQGYGLVVILEPEPGYLLTLAGLERVFAAEGEVLAEGAALGLMSGNLAAAEEFLIEFSAQPGDIGVQTLYIELREAGVPQDPADWFVTQ